MLDLFRYDSDRGLLGRFGGRLVCFWSTLDGAVDGETEEELSGEKGKEEEGEVAQEEAERRSGLGGEARDAQVVGRVEE